MIMCRLLLTVDGYCRVVKIKLRRTVNAFCLTCIFRDTPLSFTVQLSRFMDQIPCEKQVKMFRKQKMLYICLVIKLEELIRTSLVVIIIAQLN